jgi:hypothetical protein
MKRVCGHVLAGLTVLAGGASVTSACVHDDSTIFVFDVLAPQEVSNGEMCVYTSDTTQPYITSGVIDLAFPTNGYSAVYLVGNQMVPQGNPSTPQNETSYVTIQGAIVRITDSSGNQLNTYTWPTAATIPPLNGTTPSFTAISATVIDKGTLGSAAVGGVVNQGGGVDLLTYVRFYGQTTGGDRVESGEFEFPVQVCYGCLIGYAEDDPEFNAPNCANALSTAGTGTTSQTLPSPCTPGQDVAIDCSQCLNLPACNPPLVLAPNAPIPDGGAG